MSNRRRFSLRVLTLALFAASCVGAVHAAGRRPEDYPLRVHIYDKHQSHNAKYRYYHGHGRGNIVDGDQVNGMEYTFECSYSFLDSEADEDYPAKWKKPGLSLELLMGVIGSETQTRTCELKVELRDYVFAKSNGELIHITPEQYFARQSARVERQQALTPPDTDPSHYPLELSLLNLNWIDSTGGMHTATGQGNLKTQDGLAAVDFVLRCPVLIPTTPEGRYYRGRWTDPGHAMTLLLGNLTDPGAGAICQLSTTVNSDVYIRQAVGMIKAVSQDEYRKMQPQ